MFVFSLIYLSLFFVHLGLIYFILKVIPILNIAQFEQKKSLKDFYCNDLSLHLKKNSKIVHKPHKHNFFLCVIFTSGSGKHEIDFNSYVIKTGSVFFLKPGQTHYWTFTGQAKGYIFFHTQDFYEFYFSNKKLTQLPFYYSIKNPPYLTLTAVPLKTIASRFKEIYTEYTNQNVYTKSKIISLVDLVYIDLAQFYASFEPSKKVLSSTYLQTLRTLEDTIETFYKTEKSAIFYANALNISSKHLNRITKTTLNKTTTELITERVLLEAKRLIVHSKNSLSNIAEILGYEDYSYFSKVFKLKTGTTPIKFKKRYQQF